MMALTALCAFSISFFLVYGREPDRYKCPSERNPPYIYRNKCPAERKEPWSYRGKNGPLYWGRLYPDCSGLEQSPIAINSGDAIKDENLAKLDLKGYDQPITDASIENNGHTIEVTPEDEVSRTISVNGDGSFSLQQFHFHWGDAYYRGSEHSLDGTRYAMEMHLVYMNEDGTIAVVGIFFQEQDDNNEELQKIVDEFPNVKYKDDATSVQSNITLNNLLPANPTSYYRYRGSLTTPGCAEGVTWSVVPDPIPVGRDQMNQFRDLYSVEKENAKDTCKLVNNYRPRQCLNGRQVYLSQ